MIIPFDSEASYKADSQWAQFMKLITGIDSINGEAAPATYYNLNGVKVNGELAPGIYIKRQGGKSVKVIVE